MPLIDTVDGQVNPEWAKNVDKWIRLRDSLLARLDVANVPKDLNYRKAEKFATALFIDNQPTYLLKHRFETLASFRERILLAWDSGESGQIVSKYVGHLSRAERTGNVDLSDENKEKLKDNIDNNDTTKDVFLLEAAFELMGLGKCWVVTDADESGTPVSQIIERERMRDWATSKSGELIFAMYDDEVEVIGETLGRRTVDIRIIWTPLEKLTFAHIDDKWVPKGAIPNPLGYVPVRNAWMGKHALSIIDGVSKVQIDKMNIISELRHTLRQQGFNFLAIPQGASEQMATLDANAFIEINQGDIVPTYVSFPASSMDAHFSYWQNLKDNIMIQSNLGSKSATIAESGILRQWNFLDVETILNVAGDALEGLFEQILFDWASWTDAPTDNIQFEIGREFDIKDLKEKLDAVMAAFSVGIGPTAERAVRAQIRDEITDLPPEDLETSDKELDEMNNEIPGTFATMENENAAN